MDRCGRITLILLICLFLSACVPTIKEPGWKFEKETIHVHIKADQQLNLFNNKSHTLYLCFYQLSERNAFDQLAQSAGGIRKLLECKMFDSSVAAVSNKVVRAGENLIVTLDRAERAQYLAIVTGYSGELSATRVVRWQKIQLRKQLVSVFRSLYQCIPCPLNIELVLGPDQIKDCKLLVTDERCADECK
jgi:predicted component of type VI protein secretion system